MRAGLLALLQYGDGNLAEPLADLGRVFEQLPEPDCAREAGRSGVDDQHADVDALVLGIGRWRDVVARPKRRRELGRPGHLPLRARTRPVSFGTT